MIINKELNETLIRSMCEKLAPFGFSYDPKIECFVRSRASGITELFMLASREAEGGMNVRPHIGIRSEEVEDLFHKTSGFPPKQQKGTATLGSSIGTYMGGNSRDCQFLLDAQISLQIVLEQLIYVFEAFALPFYDKYKSLSIVDSELNENPLRPTSLRSTAWFRCSTGIIVAKLTKRDNYEELVEVYVKIMTNDSRGFYLDRYMALLSLLKNLKLPQ